MNYYVKTFGCLDLILTLTLLTDFSKQYCNINYNITILITIVKTVIWNNVLSWYSQNYLQSLFGQGCLIHNFLS